MTDRPTPPVTLQLFSHDLADELAQAAREVASEPVSAARLWWAKSDYSKDDAHGFIASVQKERYSGHG